MYYKINTFVPTVGVQATCSHALHWKRCHDKLGGCSWLHALRVSCTLDQSDGLCLRAVFAFLATFFKDAESPIRPAARATSACCLGARVCVCVRSAVAANLMYACCQMSFAFTAHAPASRLS